MNTRAEFDRHAWEDKALAENKLGVGVWLDRRLVLPFKANPKESGTPLPECRNHFPSSRIR